MDPVFKTKFDEMRRSNPATQGDGTTAPDSYARESHVRNVCFVLPDGNKKALSYAYLVAMDYMPEQSLITLEFTSCTISLSGLRLDALFWDLFEQLPRIITCTDERYNALESDKQPVVNKITIKTNN